MDILKNNIILSKDYKSGSVYLLNLPGNMLAVVSTNDAKDVIYSRGFFYSDKTKKKIMLESRRCYKKVKDLLSRKLVYAVEEMDFD